MLEFLIFLLATIGLTFIITQFHIFKSIRDFITNRSEFFGKLFNCPACMGMWCGMIIKSLTSVVEYRSLSNINSLISSRSTTPQKFPL